MTEFIAAGANVLGGIGSTLLNINAQRQANKANYNAQKEFYQNSILWRKQDAQRAGINPIYALGAQGAQFSPSFQAGDYSGIGQGINNAITAGLQMKELKADLKYKEQLADESKAKELYYTAMASKALKGNSQGEINVNKKVDSNTSSTINSAQPNYDVQKVGKGEFVPTTQNQQLQEQINQGIITPIYHTILGSFAQADEVAYELNTKRKVQLPNGKSLELKEGEFADVEWNTKYSQYGINVYEAKHKTLRQTAEISPLRLLQRLTSGSWKTLLK